MTANSVSDEVALLMSERGISPTDSVLGVSLKALADGSVPVPVDNIATMIALAAKLRCEPRYLYALSGHPLPPALAAADAARRAREDKAARRIAAGRAKRSAMQPKVDVSCLPPMRTCSRCKQTMDRDKFYRTGSYCRTCTAEVNREYRLRERCPRQGNDQP
jgi:hypothetical protein